MPQYYVDVTMTSFEITRNRAPQGDDPYFYWNVRLLEGTTDINGNFRPPADEQTARLHIPAGPAKAPAGFDPGTLKNVTPAFWSNPANPLKAPLTARFTANETQILAVSYFIASIVNYKVDPAARSRAFNSTVDDIETATTSAMSAGAFAGPAAPYIEAVGTAILVGLNVAKLINNAFDPPDQGEVDCSGLLASEYVGIRVSDLVRMLPQGHPNPVAAHEVRRESFQDTPRSCSAHGSLAVASITFTIQPIPDFVVDQPSSEWRVEPISGMPLTAWVGTWGESPQSHNNAIVCAITLEPPDAFFPIPRLRVHVIERFRGAHLYVYLVDVTRRVFHVARRRAGTAVNLGNGTFFVPHADAAQVDSSIVLLLYAARDASNTVREYRLKYERRDPLTGALEAEHLLVPASSLP